MKLHDVRKKSGARQPRKRVGRGRSSGTGKTSGRGHKGAKSRSGYKRKEAFEGGQMPLVRRIPKRGFSNYPFRKAWAEVNLSQLDRFNSGDTIEPEGLVKSGLVNGRFDGIVILGGGEVGVALTVRAHRFSKTAATKIEAAGGKVEVIHLKGAETQAVASLMSKADAIEVATSESEATEVAVGGIEDGTVDAAVMNEAENVDVIAAESEARVVAGSEDESVEVASDDDEVAE